MIFTTTHINNIPVWDIRIIVITPCLSGLGQTDSDICLMSEAVHLSPVFKIYVAVYGSWRFAKSKEKKPFP